MRAATLSLFTLLLLATSLWADLLSDRKKVTTRKLNTTKCAKCHKLYEPADDTEQVWAERMVGMNHKSKLSRDQADLLSRYFDTVHAEAKAPATNASAWR